MNRSRIAFVILFVFVLAQGIYIFKLKNELNKKEYSYSWDFVYNPDMDSIEKLDILAGHFGSEWVKDVCSGAKNEIIFLRNTGTLQEPSDVRYSDIVERIDMLSQHIDYQPSKNWIKEVCSSAKNEILRNR